MRDSSGAGSAGPETGAIGSPHLRLQLPQALPDLRLNGVYGQGVLEPLDGLGVSGGQRVDQ